MWMVHPWDGCMLTLAKAVEKSASNMLLPTFRRNFAFSVPRGKMAAKKIRSKSMGGPPAPCPRAPSSFLGSVGEEHHHRDLCYRLRHKVDAAVAFSPTEDAQGSLGQFIPASCIHEEFNDSLLESVLDAQRAYLKRGRKERNVLVIADDVAYDKSAFRGKAIRNTFMNGRHRKTGIILTAQYAMDMDVAIRSNADIIIAARETVVQNQESCGSRSATLRS